MFDWDDLKHFLAVARHGSTTAAGRALNTDQSTVQRRITRLEQRIGQPLVERHPSGYRLTAYGIGGRYFTPIINAPEVAILGVCKSTMQPVWDAGFEGGAFRPRLMLPLSLTWDHRVIDGAAAARFNVYLGQILGDLRRVLL